MIPFDLKKYKTGQIAILRNGKKVQYIEHDDEFLISCIENDPDVLLTELNGKFLNNNKLNDYDIVRMANPVENHIEYYTEEYDDDKESNIILYLIIFILIVLGYMACA